MDISSCKVGEQCSRGSQDPPAQHMRALMEQSGGCKIRIGDHFLQTMVREKGKRELAKCGLLRASMWAIVVWDSSWQGFCSTSITVPVKFASLPLQFATMSI